MKKRLLILAAALLLLCMLTSCKKNVGDTKSPTEVTVAEKGESTPSQDNKWAILDVTYGGQSCPVTVFKRPGGQATGLACFIALPVSEEDDLTAVNLKFKLQDGAELLPDSACIVELDGWNVTVDLTVSVPEITVYNDGYGRSYRLFTEDNLR